MSLNHPFLWWEPFLQNKLVIPLRTLCGSQSLLNRKLEEFLQSLCNLLSLFYNTGKSYPLAGCGMNDLPTLERHLSPQYKETETLCSSFVGLGTRYNGSIYPASHFTAIPKKLMLFISLHLQLNFQRNERNESVQKPEEKS